MGSRHQKTFGAPAKICGSGAEAGFSILEVLIAAVLVALAAVGASVMYGFGQALVQNQGVNRQEALLAQQRIEQIRSSGFGIGAGSATWPGDVREETAWITVPNHAGFERTTIITGVCPTNYTLAWNDASCATSTVEAKRVVVTVRAVMTGVQDPQTEPAIVQTILVAR